MKTLSISLFMLIIISPLFFPQTTWYNQNSGTSSILQDVFFVDQDYGWIAGAHIILQTTDGGETWIEQPAPPVSIFYVDIYFIDRMNGWACGNDAKIIHTTDGGNTWIEQPNPYTFPNPVLYSIYFANADTGWAIGGDHGTYPTFTNRRVVLYTTNGGNTWDFQYSASNKAPLYCAHFTSSTEGFAASEFGDVIHTSNSGNTWTETNPVSAYRLYEIYFASSSTGWASGEYLGVPHFASISKTTDGGFTWNTQSFGTDEYLTDIYFIDDMSGWAVGGALGGSGTSTILHTTDGGENWVSQNSPATNALYGLSIVDENHGWAVGFNGAVITNTNPVPVELTSFRAIVSENDVTLLWQTSTETNNSGFDILREVYPANGGTQNNNWNKIGFIEGHGTTTQENNYSYADKNLGPGLYSYRLVQIDFDGTRTESEAVNVEIENRPTNYFLMQNYPNPFNPSTKIKFIIPSVIASETKQSQLVSLKVYDVLGNEIATLVNEEKPPGIYEIEFNSHSNTVRNLPSGIYFYKLQVNQFTDTKKMILLK